jgi:low molecular weight protein-tyrosine phosphatase
MIANFDRSRGTYSRVARWCGALRSVPDRMCHAARHAEACRRIQEMERPRTVLVVCAGNRCRSPYLAGVLSHALPGIRFASAGFTAASGPVPPHALAVSSRRGLDLSDFRSTTLHPRRARTADLVVVMDAEQARYLARYMGVARSKIIIAGDLDPKKSPAREIEDPWQQSIEVFESSFDRLDRCAQTLVRLIRPAEPAPRFPPTGAAPGATEICNR